MLCYVVAHVCVNVGQPGLKFLVHAKTNGFSCCSRIVVGGCSKGRVQCMFRHCQLKSKTAVFSIRQRCRFDTFGGCGDVTELPVEIHVGEDHGLYIWERKIC